MEEMKKRFDEYFKGNIDENSYLHINTVYVRYFIQSEIDLAVSKERERIVDRIKEQAEPYDGAKWHNQLSVKTIINLINTK